jgi:Tol biopolymer transport system component
MHNKISLVSKANLLVPVFIWILNACNGLQEPAPKLNSQYIVYNSPDDQIYAVDIYSRNGSRKLANGFSPTFSPVELKVAFYKMSFGAGHKLFILDLFENNPVDLVTISKPPEMNVLADAKWSHAGTKIAYNSQKQGTMELYVYDLLEKRETKLNGARGFAPEWSYDDRKISFWTLVNELYMVAIINADGTGLRIIDLGGIPSPAKWLPDGRLVCTIRPFSESQNPSYTDVLIFREDGSERVQITNDHRSHFFGVYDERTIITATTSALDSSTRFDLIDLHTLGRKEWVTIEKSVSPVVSPDNQWIGYVALERRSFPLPIYIIHTETRERRKIAENAYIGLSWSKRF